jgi:hypothetical protein
MESLLVAAFPGEAGQVVAIIQGQRMPGAQLGDLQIFATTHSEECVQAACQAFIELGDDGLKVIRLDRQEHEAVAKVYDRDLAAAAERMDIEIRG